MEQDETSHKADAFWMPMAGRLDRVRVQVVDREPSPVSAEAQAAWDARVRANPKLFDGPILSFVRVEAEGDGWLIEAKVESYMRLVTRVGGVCHLAVTGVLRSGSQVLLGRRAEQTGVHPGAWEFVPAGGMEVPRGDMLRGEAFGEQFEAELKEEIGGALMVERETGGPRLLGLVVDPSVPSADVVIEARVARGGPAVEGGWEHDELRWVEVGALASFAREMRCIPTVAAIARAL